MSEQQWDGREVDAQGGDGFATFDQLVKKPRRTSTFTIHLPADDGAPQALKVRFRSIPPKEYDRLVAEHQPTRADRDKGMVWNPDTFPPALIAAVSDVPRLTEEQARELQDNPDWSSGEFSTLLMEALQVCNQGLNVPFNVSG